MNGYRYRPGEAAFGLRFWLCLAALGAVAWSPFAFVLVLWLVAS